MPFSKESDSVFLKFSPIARFGIAAFFASVVLAVLSSGQCSGLIKGLLAWIVFSLVFLTLDWIIIFKRSVRQIREKARADDGSTIYISILILLASAASMVGILLLSSVHERKAVEIPVAMGVVISSWLLVQTRFLFHYAHEYYDCDTDGNKGKEGGLKFPDEEEPDYLDFAYFSFCMGCCFQVSDVAVSSREMRRLVMVHGLVAFFMNTFLVALTINLVAGKS